METFKEILGDVAQVAGKAWDQVEAPMIQGNAELANALFNGNAYVPYGPGQEIEAPAQVAPEMAEPQIEMGGREM